MTTKSGTQSQASAAGTHYQEASVNVGLTGAFSATVVFKFVRVGTSVNVKWPDQITTAGATTSLNAAAASIPVGMRPAVDTYHIIRGRNSGGSIVGMMRFNSDGSMIIYAGAGGENFTSGTSSGFSAGGASYNTL